MRTDRAQRIPVPYPGCAAGRPLNACVKLVAAVDFSNLRGVKRMSSHIEFLRHRGLFLKRGRPYQHHGFPQQLYRRFPGLFHRCYRRFGDPDRASLPCRSHAERDEKDHGVARETGTQRTGAVVMNGFER